MKLSVRYQCQRSISKRANLCKTHEIIAEMRERAKCDDGLIDKFKEYDVSIGDIDSIDICFCDLDVSAKTKDCKIYLNIKMMDNDVDKTLSEAMPYLIHELVHYLQQKTGKNTGGESSDKEYMDKPSELDAFETQVEHIYNEESPDKAKDYVDRLLNYHDIDGREKKEKARELLP